eukprot:Transcript_11368.p4 GENE.Transcript_11368~~Transcript_11368.p4  ORF type:complete len:328 (-),score=163.85 Transcript_11368:1942-2925(-)
MRLAGVGFIVAFSVLLGGLSRNDCTCSCSIATVSAIIGWAYFSCWSLSFWPQTILNWYRKSVVGLSFDFVALNLAGFTCYAAFNCALYWNPTIKAEYSASHDHEQSAVKANDVFFALHACAVTALQLAQIGLYERGGQRFSIPCKVALVAILAGGAGLGAAVGAQAQGCGWLNRALALAFEDEPEEDTCSGLTLLYLLSYVKLAITLTKYLPQLVLNWRRRSTVGWNIDNVMLDFAGGSLSLGQLLLDAGCSGEWSKLIGDPVKFGLGFSSMLFDLLFMLQHFVLYRDARASAPSAPLRSPLMLADEAALSASGVPPEKTPGLMEPE